MSNTLDSYSNWARVFAPWRGRAKGSRYRYKCAQIGLESQHTPSKLNFVRESLTTADGYSGKFGGKSHINSIKTHYDEFKNKPEEIGNPLHEPIWDGLPINIEGLSAPDIVNALFGASPNGWMLGSMDLFIETPFTSAAKTIEYWNYRLLSHLYYICGKNYVISNPRESHLRAHWSMEYYLKTWGLSTIDPAATTTGPCPPLISCEEQDPIKTKTENCVLPFGTWIVADFPEPDDTLGWFNHLQEAIKAIILRDDGSFDILLSATVCVGFSFIYKASTNTYRVFIIVH